jgi:hypothetical protein
LRWTDFDGFPELMANVMFPDGRVPDPPLSVAVTRVAFPLVTLGLSESEMCVVAALTVCDRFPVLPEKFESPL